MPLPGKSRPAYIRLVVWHLNIEALPPTGEHQIASALNSKFEELTLRTPVPISLNQDFQDFQDFQDSR